LGTAMRNRRGRAILAALWSLSLVLLLLAGKASGPEPALPAVVGLRTARRVLVTDVTTGRVLQSLDADAAIVAAPGLVYASRRADDGSTTSIFAARLFSSPVDPIAQIPGRAAVLAIAPTGDRLDLVQFAIYHTATGQAEVPIPTQFQALPLATVESLRDAV